MKDEPTVLDFLRTIFQRGEKINLEEYFGEKDGKSELLVKTNPKKEKTRHQRKTSSSLTLSWIAMILAITGQFMLEPPVPRLAPALLLYSLSFLLLFLTFRKSENVERENFDTSPNTQTEIKIRKWPLLASLFFLVLAFFYFRGNEFNFLNLSLWMIGLSLLFISIWQAEKKEKTDFHVDRIFLIAAVITVGISLFIRFFQLNQVPGEMFSDHAEKLYDVMDILSGRSPIFFIRNTGREPFQFYLTAAIIRLFHTGISYLSLKIGTAGAGFITLFFIFLIGRELDGKWLGLSAALFAGIAYWPNVISRVGLRFPFYPLFAAPVIYLLIKGLKEKRLNLLTLSGLTLGIGLHGYSPFRVVPLLVTLIFLIFVISHKDQSDRHFVLTGFCWLVLTSLIIFLPLLRYSLENPAGFNYRLASRLTSLEQPINEPILLIFLQNLWKSLTMFFFNNGVIWVNSIPNRPALDVFSAALFFIGLVRFCFDIFLTKKNNWHQISILISIPVLMLPSILSLAYPAENPSLNRSSGAIVPVFLICGYGFFTMASQLFNSSVKRLTKITGMLALVLIIAGSIMMNFELVFNQYADQFIQNAWNSSEIGNEIKEFVEEGNSYQNAFVIPYPHWVDTRLVGVHAGFPGTDFALWKEELAVSTSQEGAKLFILKPEDQVALDTIKSLYPDAQEEIFYSRTPGKDFIMIHADT